MLALAIPIVSLILQIAALFLALRLIRITGNTLAWGVIGVAVALLLGHQAYSLGQMLSSDFARQPDLALELFVLAVSALLLIGIERISPMFVRPEVTVRQLRESEARYHLIFENSPISIWEEDFSEIKALFDRLRDEGISDIELYLDQHPQAVEQCAQLVRVLDVNYATLVLHGAETKQELLTGLVKTFTPESFRTFHEELICIWNGETSMRRDAMVKTLAGEPRHVTVDFSVCPGYEDSLAKVFVSLTDITERKRAEQERQLHNELLTNTDRINRTIQRAEDLESMMRDVLGEVLDIFHCDRAFLMYPCDPEAEWWTVPMERTVAEYPGAGVLNQQIPMDQGVAATLELLLAAPGAVAFGAGNERPMAQEVSERYGFKTFMSIAVRPKVGKPWQFGIHQCSHERIWTQQEGRLLEEIGRRISDGLTGLLVLRDLRESERRLVEAQNLAHIGNWELDLVTNRLTWSDEIFRIFQIDRNKFGASYEAFLDAIHPEDRDMVNNAYTESVKTRQPYDIVHRLLLPGDRIKYVREMCDTTYDEAGNPLRSLGTVQDITEQKMKEDELQRYRDHLEAEVHQRTDQLRLARNAAEAANQAKSAFLANMSHELRTPLNAILGFSRMMQQDTRLNDDQYETLDIINNSGEHLLKLINDVLEIAKIEAGKLQLEVATFDLHLLVREVSDMMQLRAKAKGLTLELDQSSEFPRFIKGDEARMRQILVNLVSNAVKFTEAGGVTIRLGGKHNMRNHLTIEVEDTGPGISDKDQQRLFQPFVQLPEGQSEMGTGLGLSIVQQFVKLMDGDISVVSSPGKGTLFRVELPVEAAEAEAIERLGDENRREVAGLAPGQPVFKILIAEDQRDNQRLLSKLMTDLGFEAKVAGNGEECVELFKKWTPDLIWMDQRMPVMDGVEATRRIRHTRGGKKVKIIAVTASAFREQKDELLGAGMDDYVRKPYTFSDVYDCLQRQLGVKFIYHEDRQDKRGPAVSLTPSMLEEIEDDQRNELREALDSLDNERIEAVIRAIGEKNPKLAAALHGLAADFNYPAIFAALDAAGPAT